MPIANGLSKKSARRLALNDANEAASEYKASIAASSGTQFPGLKVAEPPKVTTSSEKVADPSRSDDAFETTAGGLSMLQFENQEMTRILLMTKSDNEEPTNRMKCRCLCPQSVCNSRPRKGNLWRCDSHCEALVCMRCVEVWDPLICHWCYNNNGPICDNDGNTILHVLNKQALRTFTPR